MKPINLCYLLLVLLITTSCNKPEAPDFIKTTGTITTEERILEPFTEIELYNKINLVITQDSVQSVHVEAGKNLLSEITTEVKDGRLKIKNLNKFKFLRSYKKDVTVYVSLPHLWHLIYRGAGNITSTNTITDSTLTFDSYTGTRNIELSVKLREGHFNVSTGPCDILLHGSVGVNYIYNGGNGYINAEDLQTGYTFVTNGGTNDMKINVDKVLFAKISYLGNIYYKGNPYDLSYDITDKGQLIKYE